MKFETLKEQHAKRNPEDLIIDYGNYLFYFVFIINLWALLQNKLFHIHTTDFDSLK